MHRRSFFAFLAGAAAAAVAPVKRAFASGGVVAAGRLRIVGEAVAGEGLVAGDMVVRNALGEYVRVATLRTFDYPVVAGGRRVSREALLRSGVVAQFDGGARIESIGPDGWRTIHGQLTPPTVTDLRTGETFEQGSEGYARLAREAIELAAEDESYLATRGQLARMGAKGA